MRCNNEDWAVFWCSLLSPVLLGEIPERRRQRYFQQLSQRNALRPAETPFGTHPASPVAAAEKRRVACIAAAAPIGASRGKSTATCWTVP